jgi:excisionase family DNA binding protein
MTVHYRKASSTAAPPSGDNNLLTMAAAARRLQCSVRTVRRTIDVGRLRAVHLMIGSGRGVWRVYECDVERLLAEGERQ